MARRSPTGRRRTIEQMRKDARALALHCQGRSYQQIADEIGWSSKGNAYNAVKRALADLQRDRLEQTDHLTLAIERIQKSISLCQEIIDTPHFLAAPGGKIAMLTDPVTGEETPVLDDGPKQRAITEMRHLNDQLILLADLRPASKSRVEVVTEDVVDKEIEKLAKEIADAGTAAGPGVLREAPGTR